MAAFRHVSRLALLSLVGLVSVAVRRQRETGVKETELGGRRVSLWMPRASSNEGAVVLFSHGFHGNAQQSRSLMQALAGAGYLVVAIDHADTVGRGHFPDSLRPPIPFREDVLAVFAALQRDPRLGPLVNPDRVALIGHSLGGYTMLGLCGAWPGWRSPDLRPRAVVALSPHVRPFVAQRTLHHLDVPVMYQGGTRDGAVTPTVSQADGAYDQGPAPKYFVSLEKAGHFAWCNLRSAWNELIEHHALAFLAHRLDGQPADAILSQPAPGVRELRRAL